MEIPSRSGTPAVRARCCPIPIVSSATEHPRDGHTAHFIHGAWHGHPIPFLKANLLLRLRPLVATRSLVRDLFFAADTPQEIVERCFARLQDESYLAFIDTMIVLARPHRVNVPALVLGAEGDTFFTVREVQATARAYRTEAEIFPGMGHDMMLDEGWNKVADRVHAWVHECLHAEPLGTR